MNWRNSLLCLWYIFKQRFDFKLTYFCNQCLSFIFGKNPRFTISGLICQLRSIISFFHSINICVIQVVNTAFIQRSTFISVTSVVEFGVQKSKAWPGELAPSPTPIFSIKKENRSINKKMSLPENILISFNDAHFQKIFDIEN